MKKVFQEQHLLLSFKGKQKSHSNSRSSLCEKQNKTKKNEKSYKSNKISLL